MGQEKRIKDHTTRRGIILSDGQREISSDASKERPQKKVNLEKERKWRRRMKKKRLRTSGLRAIGCPVVTSKLPPPGPSLPATSTEEAGLRLAPIPEPWYRLLMCLYDFTDFIGNEKREVKRTQAATSKPSMIR